MKSHGQLPEERQLYWEILQCVGRRERLARATLVHAWGSTPREVGAKMLVYQDGSIRGTVGGGCGEAEVWQAAMEALESGQARRVEVDLTEDAESDSGKVCGGRFEVFIDVWQAGLPWLEALQSALESEEESTLWTDMGPPPRRAWQKSPTPVLESHGPSGTSHVEPGAGSRARVVVREEGREWFADPLITGLELVIAGAGHIARPLCKMASLCGYRVVVLDDRCEYAVPEFFPEAREVVCEDWEAFFRRYRTHARSHVVLVTRGHKYDEMCLRALVGRELGYVGMIGSRKRVRAVMEDLRGEGAQAGWLQRVHAPIGLDLGALTPEEIAVSILAELILLRRGGKGGSMSLSREA